MPHFYQRRSPLTKMKAFRSSESTCLRRRLTMAFTFIRSKLLNFGHLTASPTAGTPTNKSGKSAHIDPTQSTLLSSHPSSASKTTSTSSRLGVAVGQYSAAKPGTPTAPPNAKPYSSKTVERKPQQVENITQQSWDRPLRQLHRRQKRRLPADPKHIDGDFGLYVIRNATEFRFWDFGLEISANKVEGDVPVSVKASSSASPFPLSPSPKTPHLTSPVNSGTTLPPTNSKFGMTTKVNSSPPSVPTSASAKTPTVRVEEGDLWYDSKRLELFVYYTDPSGVSGWLRCSPLGARVEAGEILQEQINYLQL